MNSQHENDEQWMAYVDGQLSTSEAAAFDSGLSAAEKSRAEQEIRFERAIGEVLTAGPGCPDHLWEELRSKIAPGRKSRWQPFNGMRGFAFAAAASLVVGLGVLAQAFFGSAGVLDLPPTVAALQSEATFQPDIAQIQAWLDEQGIDLSVLSVDAMGETRHPMTMLGATLARYRNEEVLELLYNCCGQPAKVVLAPENSRVAAELRQGEGRGKVQDSLAVNGYLAAVVSPHRSPELLDLIRPRSPAMARLAS